MSQTSEKYLDPSLPVQERVRDLMAQMTLEEKVGQTLQWNGRDPKAQTAIHDWHAGSLLHVLGEQLEELRKESEKTRLKIPLLFGIDAIHGNAFWAGATVFPTQLAQACAFDEGLVEKTGKVTAVETAATGAHWVFSPVFCLSRDLRWGRVDETFGEDPWLIGKLGAAMVQGLQHGGMDNPEAVAACAKHYAGYSETQGGRDASEATLSRRRMLQTFLPPFKAAVDAGCRTFMTGYQSLDGVPCTANAWLMKNILREAWGFDGMVVTDWDNVKRMVTQQRVREDVASASIDAVNCENDMIMMTEGYFEAAVAAVKDGRLQEAAVDKLCARVLALKFELGLFEGKRVVAEGVRKNRVAPPEHLEISQEASRKSLVLLKNDGTLPLKDGIKVGLFGPMADNAGDQLGDWSNGSGQAGLKTQGHPRDMIITVADGMKALADKGRLELVRESSSESFGMDAAAVKKAAQAAAGCDVLVAVVGDTIAQNGECRDRADLNLDAGQPELLEALKATGKPLVVILMTGKPLTVPWVKDHAAGVVQAFSPGLHGGQALAELLMGDIEPYGRLPISFAAHSGQQPVTYDQIPGWHAEAYCDMNAEPLWAFGEGLAYTSFEVGEPKLKSSQLNAGQDLEFSVELRNTGSRRGHALVQAYFQDLVSSVTTPVKRLRAFARADLEPGKSVKLDMRIDFESLGLVTPEEQWVVEPGEFELMVGLSSRDAEMKKSRFQVLASA